MLKLHCTVGPGVFSHERLIRFKDADGRDQSALVDQGFVRSTSNQFWLEVRGEMYGATAIVAMPNDGSRVRVPLSEVEAIS
jgi:hypothetical protein